MVVPTLTALLSDTPRQVVRDLGPLLRTVEVDQLEEQPVLDVGPWPFHKGWVEYLLPSVETLHVSPTAQSFCDLLPVLTSVDPDSLGQFFVLYLGPMALDLDMVTLSMVLGGLVLSWPSLVQVGIQHLVPDEFLLSLAVSQIIQVVGPFHFLNFD